jgi:hypothetical protein
MYIIQLIQMECRSSENSDSDKVKNHCRFLDLRFRRVYKSLPKCIGASDFFWCASQAVAWFCKINIRPTKKKKLSKVGETELSCSECPTCFVLCSLYQTLPSVSGEHCVRCRCKFSRSTGTLSYLFIST